MEAVWEAEDMASAVERVAELLSVSPENAKRVVELRLLHMTKAGAARTARERADLLARLRS